MLVHIQLDKRNVCGISLYNPVLYNDKLLKQCHRLTQLTALFSLFNNFLLNEMVCNCEQNAKGNRTVKRKQREAPGPSVTDPCISTRQVDQFVSQITTSLSSSDYVTKLLPHLFHVVEQMSLCGVATALQILYKTNTQTCHDRKSTYRVTESLLQIVEFCLAGMTYWGK